MVSHLDVQHRGIEQAQQFVLERHHGPGNAHEGQHQSGRDTEQPVQLKQRFLQHGDPPCSI